MRRWTKIPTEGRRTFVQHRHRFQTRFTSWRYRWPTTCIMNRLKVVLLKSPLAGLTSWKNDIEFRGLFWMTIDSTWPVQPFEIGIISVSMAIDCEINKHYGLKISWYLWIQDFRILGPAASMILLTCRMELNSFTNLTSAKELESRFYCSKTGGFSQFLLRLKQERGFSSKRLQYSFIFVVFW